MDLPGPVAIVLIAVGVGYLVMPIVGEIIALRRLRRHTICARCGNAIKRGDVHGFDVCTVIDADGEPRRFSHWSRR